MRSGKMSIILLAFTMAMGESWLFAQATQTPATETAPVRTPSAQRGGRRDPFQPIVIRPPQQEIPAQLPPGLRGLVIGQIRVQGIVRGINNEWIAVVDNNTNRAYFLRERDEVWNGVVSRITVDTVTFQERSTDANGRITNRDVEKKIEQGTTRRRR